MGTGKTAVGRALAAKLGKEFIELDGLISERAGKSISRIFEEDGETSFRELEIQIAKEAGSGENRVIAGGGGVVLNQINLARLREKGIIVYLTAAPEIIFKRVSGDSGRPLLNTAERLERIKELLEFRKPFYERSYDIKVNTSKLSIESVARRIIQELKRYESRHC